MNHTTNDLLALKKNVDEALEANRNLHNKIAKQKSDSVLQNRIAVLGRWSTYRKLLRK
jgi:hypothetical protein